MRRSKSPHENTLPHDPPILGADAGCHVYIACEGCAPALARVDVSGDQLIRVHADGGALQQLLVEVAQASDLPAQSDA